MRMVCAALVCGVMFAGVVEVCASVMEEVAKIHSGDAFVGDVFGLSVAAEGDILVVGATGDDDNGSASGSVYVFDISDPADPVQLSKLVPEDGDAGQDFGVSVAVHGSMVVVGAMRDDDNAWDAGGAYVFDISNPVRPVQRCKLIARDGSENDQLGIRVALSGNMVVVGALADSDLGDLAGSAYMFDISDLDNPRQLCKLVADDAETWDFFGGSVAISGKRVLVGAYGDDDRGSASGSVYVFDLTDPSSPKQVYKLRAGDGETGDMFGQSVAISGNTVLVGAGGDDDNGENAGGAYIFDISDRRRPVAMGKLVASDGDGWAIFGQSVAVDGTRAVIGAWWDSTDASQAGSAYGFDISDPANPVEIYKYRASDGERRDYLGQAVAVTGEVAIAGAYGDSDNGEDSGSVFVFELVGCDSDANGDNAVDVNDISYVLFRLGDPCPMPGCDGDVNGDGVIDVNDISYVLFRLGNFCP